MCDYTVCTCVCVWGGGVPANQNKPTKSDANRRKAVPSVLGFACEPDSAIQLNTLPGRQQTHFASQAAAAAANVECTKWSQTSVAICSLSDVVPMSTYFPHT